MTLTCKVDFQWRIFGLYINTRKLFYHLNKVEARYLTILLMNEAEYLMKNYGDRGGCYRGGG